MADLLLVPLQRLSGGVLPVDLAGQGHSPMLQHGLPLDQPASGGQLTGKAA